MPSYYEPTVWPEGVIARYLTIGRATVDISEQCMSRCTGCGEDDSEDIFVSRCGTTLSRARRWAQAHAEKCRALPRPTA